MARTGTSNAAVKTASRVMASISFGRRSAAKNRRARQKTLAATRIALRPLGFAQEAPSKAVTDVRPSAVRLLEHAYAGRRRQALLHAAVQEQPGYRQRDR